MISITTKWISKLFKTLSKKLYDGYCHKILITSRGLAHNPRNELAIFTTKEPTENTEKEEPLCSLWAVW